MTSLFLVDDHAVFLSGLRAELQGAFEIVGLAGDVETAVAGIASTKPDVVLLDVHLPGGGGRAVLEQCAASGEVPTTRFLALSVSDAAEDVIGVIRAGARGYVTKSISPAELADAIARVRDDDAVFSPRLAGFVLDAFRTPAVPAHGPALGVVVPQSASELDRLTVREQDVLRQIARGFAYKQVAANLHVSVKTVESHMSAVLRKLQLSSRHELTVWATDRRIV